MLSPFPTLLCFAMLAAAAPHRRTPGTGGLSMDLQRRAQLPKTTEELALWAKSQRDALHTKYGRSVPSKKRSSGTNLCVFPIIFALPS